MAENDDPSIEALNAAQNEQASPTTFDHYGSVADPSIRIFVANDAVPPFRFKAGGWELLTSSIDLGPAMKTRITENGYFLYRVKDDRSGWIELTEEVGWKTSQTPSPSLAWMLSTSAGR
jgi:hypothetical protein